MSEKSSEESGRDTQFWLIRHAESTWNAAGLWQGQEDPPLSERGRFQAARLAEALAQERVEILITSDLVRTVETAEIVASRLALEAYRESGLRELDAGSWSGSSRQQIASRDGDLLARFEVRGKPPRAVMVVAVEEAFNHCPKAFVRADLWRSGAKGRPEDAPTIGDFAAFRKGADKAYAAKFNAEYAERMKEKLY